MPRDARSCRRSARVGEVYVSQHQIVGRREGLEVRTLAMNGLQTDPMIVTATLMAPRRE